MLSRLLASSAEAAIQLLRLGCALCAIYSAETMQRCFFNEQHKSQRVGINVAPISARLNTIDSFKQIGLNVDPGQNPSYNVFSEFPLFFLSLLPSAAELSQTECSR